MPNPNKVRLLAERILQYEWHKPGDSVHDTQAQLEHILNAELEPLLAAAGDALDAMYPGTRRETLIRELAQWKGGVMLRKGQVVMELEHNPEPRKPTDMDYRVDSGRLKQIREVREYAQGKYECLVGVQWMPEVWLRPLTGIEFTGRILV